MKIGSILRAFQAPPSTPPLGASCNDVLALYPKARPTDGHEAFAGQVLRSDDGDDTFHFVSVAGRLEEAVYSTRWSSLSRKALGRKLKYFLDAYGGADNFEIKLDNGFGYTIHRDDKLVWALYSYACDVFSVGRMSEGEMVLLDWQTRGEVT